MSLPPLPTSDWSAEIGAAAEEFMNATATFYASGSTTVLFTTKARVQHLRAPLDSSTATAWATKRAIRLQIPLDATTGLVKRGLIARVSGGNDPTLENIAFTVQSAVNSSHAALRTIECVSEVVQVPAVTP